MAAEDGSGAAGRGNLFAALPDARAEERFEVIGGSGAARVERIVSHGQASPAGFWYDQDEDEWVALLAGRARVEIEGEAAPVELAPGDWLELPAHRRHRVSWTTPEEPTVWLAFFYPPGAERFE
jgi:cupin 2 domain-containing protein